MNKKMVTMLAAVGILFCGIFGYKTFTGMMMKKYMSAGGMPPVTVSTVRTATQEWQPQLKAVGTLRAVYGVDVTCESAGLVQSILFKSGDDVKAGQLLVQFNVDSDMAQLSALDATAELAKTTFERDKKQLDAQTISQASLDVDAADLKVKQAMYTQVPRVD